MTKQVRGRKAYTLLEMVILIGVTGVLMSLAAVSLQQSMQSQQVALSALLRQSQLDGLRLRLKMDLAMAQTVSIDGQSVRLVSVTKKTQTQQTMLYEFGELGVNRTLTSLINPTESTESWTSHTWRVPVTLVHFQMDESGSVPIVRICVRIAAIKDSSSSEEFDWLFRVGREVAW